MTGTHEIEDTLEELIVQEAHTAHEQQPVLLAQIAKLTTLRAKVVTLKDEAFKESDKLRTGFDSVRDTHRWYGRLKALEDVLYLLDEKEEIS